MNHMRGQRVREPQRLTLGGTNKHRASSSHLRLKTKSQMSQHLSYAVTNGTYRFVVH